MNKTNFKDYLRYLCLVILCQVLDQLYSFLHFDFIHFNQELPRGRKFNHFGTTGSSTKKLFKMAALISIYLILAKQINYPPPTPTPKHPTPPPRCQNSRTNTCGITAENKRLYKFKSYFQSKPVGRTEKLNAINF